MIDKEDRPSSTEFLASIVMGNAGYRSMTATVQRSHRFPLHLFAQIENMARMGGVSVSLIINQLLECGLEAVKEELPPDVMQEVSMVKNEQIDRPTVTDVVDVKRLQIPGNPNRAK